MTTLLRFFGLLPADGYMWAPSVDAVSILTDANLVTSWT